MINIGVDPVAFSIGPITIGWYSIMVTLAVITLVTWALWAVKKGAKVSYDTVITAALVGIPSGVIFSRLLHVIDYWDIYSKDLGSIIGGEGLSIYGAVLGAALGIWIYSKIRKISFGYLSDMLAPGIILAQAIGRVGCTLNGCCYGIATNLPWGIVYTDAHSNGFAASQKVLPEGMGLHPTQVYEIIYNLIIFGVLLLLRKRFRPDGSLFLIYLVCYAAWRLGIDFIRDGKALLFGLHEAQLISIVVLIIAIVQLVRKTRWVKKGEGEETGEEPAA